MLPVRLSSKVGMLHTAKQIPVYCRGCGRRLLVHKGRKTGMLEVCGKCRAK